MNTQPSSGQPYSLNISTDILLSMATIPVLLGLVGARAIAEGIVELGRASEEVFRGDRLPVLNLQPPTARNRFPQ